MVLGFFEDYRKIMLNMKQELVLIQSSSDLEAVMVVYETKKPRINNETSYWRVAHVFVGIPQ